MFLTPFYVAMTFIRTWRMRSFRARLLEFLGGDTSVAFCRVPENAAETPTLSSKLCTNPKNAHLCDLYDYSNTVRVCSMKPLQSIELRDWVSCSGGLPLGVGDSCDAERPMDLAILLECEMEQKEQHGDCVVNYVRLDTLGSPLAWKAGSHLAVVVRTDVEHLTQAGFNFVNGEVIIDHRLPVVRIQTVLLSGTPNSAKDPSMRTLRSDIQHNLKKPRSQFQWGVHAALLRKLSKVVEIKSEANSIEMNGYTESCTVTPKHNVSLTDVSVNTVQALSSDIGTATENGMIYDKDYKEQISDIKENNYTQETTDREEQIHSPKENIKTIEDINIKQTKEVVNNNPVTVELKHSITPKKSSLKLDLKKGTSQLSSSLLNISSQIKSVTTHKRVIGPKKITGAIDKNIKAKNDKTKSPCNEKSPPIKPGRVMKPLVNTKQVNVIIYSDSIVARDNLEASLKKVLDSKSYTVYCVSRESLESGAWRGRAALVAVAGDVSGRAGALLLAHLLAGGRLLALCCDLLHTAIPYYTTAEVRENEIVQFSYDKWESVRMKHHIFCYQASPAKKQFSTETDKQPSKYTGHPGHELDIQILASEETWRTPSLLQATDVNTRGIAIFSQIHLEEDPSEYLGAEGVPLNTVRLEILEKILKDIFGLHTKPHDSDVETQYTRGYFLGNHVHKMALVDSLCPAGDGPRIMPCGSLAIQWCGRGEVPARSPASDFLPVMLLECPENFSTVEYYDTLTSRRAGRLVVYSERLASSQAVAEGLRWSAGVAVVPREMTAGRGRTGNKWIGGAGCAMITLQMHMQMSGAIPLVQHAGALAAVRAVRALPGYDTLDIRIKWPNDIYYGRELKIGGVLTTASVDIDLTVVNIGLGMNLDNCKPTTCINEIIRHHNSTKPDGQKHLAELSLEKFLARFCSQTEKILDDLETDDGIEAFLQQYYTYWLHDGEEVQVTQPGSNATVSGVIVGLNSSGYLRVRSSDGELTVHPGDNTFDMMAGLIAPKL